MSSRDSFTLLLNGKRYGGWTSAEVSRGIDKAVSSFSVSVTERWASGATPWQIVPFDSVQLFIGADLVLTGYVEKYAPSFDGRAHSVRVTGHSRTKDLVDCTPDVPSGQYSGYTLAAIAKAVCALFKIGVVVQTDLAAAVVANANLQRGEKAFNFLERLGRLAGVLLTDDENGNLVLTTAGSVKSATKLALGVNVLSASATIDAANRFSAYILKGQAGIAHGVPDYNGAGGIYGPTLPGSAQAGTVQTALEATAKDASVPRYRPRVTLAESQYTLAQLQQRANWQKQWAYGQATKATVTLATFRQASGKLWRPNLIVATNIPWLEIDTDLLLVSVRFEISERGGIAQLELGPVEGYTPDPGEVKLVKGKKGKVINWSGASNIA